MGFKKTNIARDTFADDTFVREPFTLQVGFNINPGLQYMSTVGYKSIKA